MSKKIVNPDPKTVKLTPAHLPPSAINGAKYLTHYLLMIMRETGFNLAIDSHAEIDEILTPAFQDIYNHIQTLEARIAALESEAK